MMESLRLRGGRRFDMEFPMHLPPARVIALLILTLCAPAAARVIGVGPDREARTLEAAIARAKVGDEIVLDRAIEHLTSGVVVSVDAVEIRSADGPGEPATIRNISTGKWPVTIEHRAEGLILKDLIMAGAEGVNITAIRGKGARLTVDNVSPSASVWRFVHIDGAQQTVVRNCTAPVLPDYTVCSFGGISRNLILERCTFGGSVKEHTIRLHKIQGALLRDSTFDVGGKKSALTIRDGADVRVENCTINGPVAIGPVADGDGGINLPTDTPQQRAQREAMLRRNLRDVTLENCTINTNGINVEMGTENLVLEACSIKTNKQSALRLNRDEYEPWRKIPSGRLVHCELIGPPGLRPFETPRPDFHAVGTVINGVRVPDTAEPTTQPSAPGGAVPAEAPTTQPTEQVHAQRSDVLAALDRVEDALAQLHLARARLHASMQPVADTR
ncbi:MAG TPA: right-handed parallel beta-helix repeat-containing protein [Tepidisphaeraceae bacterium]|nr:right-handed parallel beta-helix repeat-containing protein [Tepidisphaeraceae bacterium]